MVTIEMMDGKQIKIELMEQHAPITANNFKSLAAKGFYDGLCFHRVISGFMIQGGCPRGTGTGGPGYTIKGEFKANGVNNTLRHTRVFLSMSRAASYDSAGSHFLSFTRMRRICGQYAAFGRVLEGMDVVDAIAAQPTDAADGPKVPQVIRKMAVTEDETPAKPE